MPRDLPLADIMVFELGHSVAAPFAAEILADLGAKVVKIEKSDGDDARKWAPPYLHGMSAIFRSLNRNKRSVVVNLRNESEKAKLLERIVKDADVVIQNLRPGLAASLGLDGPTLVAMKPSLVYCSIGAFGSQGPLRMKPGYDPLMQAFSGLMSVTGEPGHNPVRVGTSIIDMATGMWSVIGVLSALAQRVKTKKGAVIETSLFESALVWMCYHAANYQASGELPKREGSGVAQIVPYRGYDTSDGYIVVGAGNDKLFRLMVGVLGHTEWAADDRFKTNPDRVRNKDMLYRMIEDVVVTRTTEEWREQFEAAGVPCAPAQTIDQVLAHEQTRALNIIQRSPDDSHFLIGLPLAFDGERPPFRLGAPELGADTEAVLTSVGGSEQ